MDSSIDVSIGLNQSAIVSPTSDILTRWRFSLLYFGSYLSGIFFYPFGVIYADNLDSSEEIHACIKDLKKFLDEDHSMKDGVSQKAIFENKLENIVDKFDGFEELSKPMTYIKNGIVCWYTCMLYSGMEPTNNLGEQAILEHVILRKIIGCFCSENGAENYQYIASLLADWRLQGKNGFEELEQLLRRELCIS